MSGTEIITKVFLEHNLKELFKIKSAGVFGSSAHSDTFNDIDILVEMEDDIQVEDFKNILEKLTNKKVDVVPYRWANPIILFRALKDINYVA